MQFSSALKAMVGMNCALLLLIVAPVKGCKPASDTSSHLLAPDPQQERAGGREGGGPPYGEEFLRELPL